MKNKHFIHIHNPEAKGKRMLILGGDITVCENGFAKGVKQEKNDYVHIICRFSQQSVHDFGFCIMQSKSWEQNYKNSDDISKLYVDGEKFRPDIMVLQIGDHIDKIGFDEKLFKDRFEKFICRIDPLGKSKKVLLTSFSKNVSDGAVQDMAEYLKCPCIYLGNIGSYEELCENGLPNNKGMDRIARAVLCIIENYLKK